MINRGGLNSFACIVGDAKGILSFKMIARNVHVSRMSDAIVDTCQQSGMAGYGSASVLEMYAEETSG